ncbi:hypothetical protein MXB_4957, partial [Myxobolus squamalis]
MNVIERSLALIACKYVNWVIIDAPYRITNELVKRYHIKKIYYGDCDYNKNDRFDKYSAITDIYLSTSLPPRDLSCDFVFDRIRMRRNGR